MSYEDLFVNAGGRTSRLSFALALIPLLLAAALYAVMVKGRTGEWCLMMLLYPAVVLHARRLHDMGVSALVLILPAALLLAGAWLKLYGQGMHLPVPVGLAATVVAAAFVLWGLAGKGQAEANRFGEAAG